MKKPTTCPYKDTTKNKCTHKDIKGFCIFKEPYKCPIFNKWVELLEKEENAQEDA